MKSSYRQGFWRLGKGVLAAAALLGLVVGTGGAASAAEDRQVYVALGDSMASGPLIPNITGPVACGRSTNNYAHELAASLGVDELRDVTCSGADTKDMTQPQSLSLLGVDMGTAPPQFDALSADTTLVTLTIGGNDAGLVGIAQDCVNLNPFAATCKSRYTAGGVDQVATRVDSVAPKLAAVLDGIHTKAPNARVIVTGYGLYIKPGGCWPVQPVLPTDADYLQANVDRLNSVIATQAAAHNAEYVDVRAPSIGHDICRSSSTRWIEGFVPTNLAAPLHPNQRGEENYALIIEDAIT